MTVSSLPKGTTFARIATALAISHNNPNEAAGYAAKRWGETARATLALKEAVSAGGTGVDGWSTLPTMRDAATEFFGLVRSISIIGRLSALRRVPPRTRMIRPTAGTASQWIGEADGKPIGGISFAELVGLPLRKVVALSVITKELLEATSDDAESFIRLEMARSMASTENVAFIDPANAGQADVKPASVTHDLAAVGGGSPTSNFEDDFDALLDGFEGDLEFGHLIMTPQMAAKLSGAERPNVGARGGEIAGIPTITSTDVPTGTVALIDPTGIAYTEGGGGVRTSEQATVEMVDESSQDAASSSGAQLVSLWQANSVGILAESFMNWTVARPGSVCIITDASY